MTHVFPQPVPLNDEQRIVLLQGEGGLTKRELFSIMILQGMVIAQEIEPYRQSNPGEGPIYPAARCAIACADSLLAELAKKGGE